jgi:hypothetical protein
MFIDERLDTRPHSQRTPNPRQKAHHATHGFGDEYASIAATI